MLLTSFFVLVLGRDLGPQSIARPLLVGSDVKRVQIFETDAKR